MTAVAKLFDRLDPQHSGLAWEIHLFIRALRRGHRERIKQAALIRECRQKVSRA